MMNTIEICHAFYLYIIVTKDKTQIKYNFYITQCLVNCLTKYIHFQLFLYYYVTTTIRHLSSERCLDMLHIVNCYWLCMCEVTVFIDPFNIFFKKNLVNNFSLILLPHRRYTSLPPKEECNLQ